MTLTTTAMPLHTRSLTVVATLREDGLWSVDCQVIDLRKSSFVPMPDEAHTAGIIHNMGMLLVVDPATRVLRSLDVVQHAVAMERSAMTGGESCRDPVSRLQALVGARFDAELPGALSRTFGGPRGCSHLLTLFFLTASALPRALDFEETAQRAGGPPREAGEKLFRRAVFLDGSAPAEGMLQLAVQLTDFHARPRAAVRDRLDHLALHAELRTVALVRLAEMAIVELRVGERERTRETLSTATWQDRSDLVAELVGLPIMPGLGSAARARLGGRPEAARLLDTLVQLAPGFVQCTPTLTDALLGRLNAQSGSARPALPSFMAHGGGTDSCYMWRRGGPLVQLQPFSRDSAAGD